MIAIARAALRANQRLRLHDLMPVLLGPLCLECGHECHLLRSLVVPCVGRTTVAARSRIGALDVDVPGAERPLLAGLQVVRVAPDAARVIRQQVDRDRGLGRRRSYAVDVVRRRKQARRSRRERARAARRARARRRASRRSPRPAFPGTARRAPTRGGRARASRHPAGTTSENSESDPSPARKSSHWPIPPPMPLSGASDAYSSGSQASSSRSSAKPGRIASQASSGERAVEIALRTCGDELANGRACRG